MTSYQNEVDEVLDEHEEAVEDYLNGEDGALNFLVGCVMQKTGGSMNPSEASEAVQNSIQEQWDEPIEWPVELPYYLRYDQDAIAEKLWNVFRERNAPEPDPDAVPDRFDEPEVELPLSIHEDGTVTLGRGKSVPDERLFGIWYDDKYTYNEKVTELGVPDTDEAYRAFNHLPEVRIWYEFLPEETTVEPVEVRIDNSTYVLVER